jgi:hypothetical protein
VNLAACRKLAVTPENGTWYRAVQVVHLKTPINTAHTTRYPTRFSAGPDASRPFEILYLADNPLVAQFETVALAGDPLTVGGLLIAPISFAIVHVNVVLQRVADLTQVDQQDLIETTAQELTGDWRGYKLRSGSRSSVKEPIGTAPTQDLGETLFEVPGIEGFRTLSAKLAYHRSLVIFPQKMFKGSHLEFRDDPASLLQNIVGKVPKKARHGWRP